MTSISRPSYRLKILPIIALLLGVLVLSVAVTYMHLISTPDVALAIKNAEIISLDTDVIPDDELPGWKRVSLPDNWASNGRENTETWYRIILPLNVAPNRLWGIYLPTVHMNAAVYLNGELLGHGGSFEDPVARNDNRPLYFSIPNGMLVPDDNFIHIRVKSDPILNGLLSTVYLGPAQFVEPAYDTRYFIRYSLAQFIVLAMIMTGLIMATLWWRRRQDTVYGWFSLAILVWAIHNLDLIFVEIPFNTRLWDDLSAISILWFSAIATTFVLRFLNEKNTRYEKNLYVLCGVFSLAILFLSDEWFYHYGSPLAVNVALLVGVYPVYRLLRHAWREPGIEAFLLMFSAVLLLTFGIHDALLASRIIDGEGSYMHYSAPIALIVIAEILFRRFILALNKFETLNVELADRVAAREAELKINYQQLRAYENKQVLQNERERIMRDMHDGMGGHLVSTISLLESGCNDAEQLKEVVQLAMSDLRLMIDSMDDIDGDLLAVLGLLRQRLEPRLKQVGIGIVWKISMLPEISNFGPEKALHVMRILQEAITNIIKYADASTITFKTGVEKGLNGLDGVYVTCVDNGVGIPSDLSHAGHGLANMKKRAEKMNGHVKIDRPEQGGTRVYLWIPCN